MAGLTYYMNYTIFIRDPTLYSFAVGLAGSNILQMAPRTAAAQLGIPFPYPSGNIDTIPIGIFFYTPFVPGQQFLFPGPTGIFVDDTVLSQVIPGQAGNPASIWPAGPSATFIWSGNIVKMGGAGLSSNPPPTAIARRRWIGGREIGSFGEGGQTISNFNMLRDSSRTMDGFGWCIRGNSTTLAWNKNVADTIPAFAPANSWERFYFRLRAVPSGQDVGLWRCHGTPNTECGCALKILQSTGNVHLFSLNNAAAQTDQGTVFQPVIGTWNRIDIFLRYTTSDPNGGRIFIFLNGTLVKTFTDLSSNNMNANTAHTFSELGKWNSVAELECEADLDDWMCADLPGNVDSSTLNFLNTNYSIDWLLGSHIKNYPAISASQTNWAPTGAGVGVANQNPSVENRLGTSQLASTTSGATFEVLTGALLQSQSDSLGQVMGAVAAVVSYQNLNAAGTDGTLGYRKAGAAATLTSINQLAAEANQFVTYNIATANPVFIPDEIAPWSLTHVKSADANNDQGFELVTSIEYIGVWGPEDDPSFNFPVNRLSFTHNCRYANTPWGYFGSQPSAPVYAIGGTYTGNGTYQEFTLPTACNFLWIRPVLAGTAGGSKGISGGILSNLGATARVIPNVQMFYDFTNQLFKFSVTGGANSGVNENTVQYQYIAFCDPGMRFNLSGAFSHGSGTSTPKVNLLIANDFQPDFGLVQSNCIANQVNTTGLWSRGPGSTLNNATPLDATALEANGFTMSTGILRTFSRMHSGGDGNPPYCYSLWRMQDSGPSGCLSNVMIQVLTYTGNGTSPRNITLTPTSGRFPLFTLVSPASAGGTSYMRDPSHTGTNSSDVQATALLTNGITAVGIDQITVQSGLNANGVVYNVFVICGDSAGNNNGTFNPYYCAGDGPYIPPTLPQGVSVLGNGGLTLDGTTPQTLLKDISGIYTLSGPTSSIPTQRHDTLYDRQTGQPNVNVAIPNPNFKTGYVGG